jgi:hypothetical protein
VADSSTLGRATAPATSHPLRVYFCSRGGLSNSNPDFLLQKLSHAYQNAFRFSSPFYKVEFYSTFLVLNDDP